MQKLILNTQQIKDVCSKILFAVDSEEKSFVTEVLEMYTEGSNLFLQVTNREYFVRVKMESPAVEFHATLNARVFLKLISQITTDTVEFELNDSVLYIKGNGSYKLPLVMSDDKIFEIPTITINNVTYSTNMNYSILDSILQYNSKELKKDIIVNNQIQRMYYIDEMGAITFTNGACVNSFTLDKPVKVLLTQKVVKLFKLFSKTDVISFKLGKDQENNQIYTKVEFNSDSVYLSAIIPDDTNMINKMPAAAIRTRALKEYPYSVTISKDSLASAINRLNLFTNTNSKPESIYFIFDFSSDGVTLYDSEKENNEFIKYSGPANVENINYSLKLNIPQFKIVLDSYEEDIISVQFGDTVAIVLSKGNIKTVIPEVHIE